MHCNNHAELAAVDRCAGCAEGFCENCLVEIQGAKYCRECKYMTVKTPPAPLNEKSELSDLAADALKYALIGIFCFGIVLGPMAISKGVEARKDIKSNPTLFGIGKANAAILIGVFDFLGWLANIMTRFS